MTLRPKNPLLWPDEHAGPLPGGRQFFSRAARYEIARIGRFIGNRPVTAALLEAQPEWHDGKMDGAWAAAEKAGLNVAKARAMPTTDAMAWMEQDIADARAVGVRGTPTFFVNGEMLVQPSPEQVEARVQAAVAAKGK